MLDSKSSASNLLFEDSNNTDNINDTKPKTYPATPLSKPA
jgi:hypothetical protein